MQLQALDFSLSSFHEFLPILLSTVPNSHWALWSQFLTAFRPVQSLPQAPDTVQGAFSSKSSATTHVHPAPSSLLCQHSVQSHAAQLEACLSVKDRGLCPSQARLAAHLTVQVCVGCLHLHIGARHLSLKQMGEVLSKPEQQDFASSLHNYKLLTCITLEQRKVNPIRSTCVSHNSRVVCYEERFFQRKALFKVVASVLAGEEIKI